MKFSIGEIATIWHPTDSQLGGPMSHFHGTECEIDECGDGSGWFFNCDYRITVGCQIFYVMESELRKKPQDKDDASHYNGTVVSSWDSEGTIWKPTKETADA